jgi:serine/threonine-protein phosphatase 2B catalytic subunit
MCDLAWSDPADDTKAVYNDWDENRARDCSYYFGRDPTREFLDKNKLVTIFRGHQVKQNGYQKHSWDGPNKPPLVITVFSAPNYCGTYANKGGIVLLQ